MDRARRPWEGRRPGRTAVATAAALALLGPGAAASSAPPAPVEHAVGDVELVRALEFELRSERLGLLDPIRVRALDGVVTLVGRVDSLLERDRALDVVRATRGVRGIVDRIAVEPVVRSDEELAADLSRALGSDPAIEPAGIEVSVRDGAVDLSGRVGSWPERDFAVAAARGVPGVRSVRGALSVDFSEPRPDAEIREDVERRLAADVRVDAGLVEVAVEDGSVRLRGAVGSLAERDRAYTLAWVTGVKHVDAGGLELRWWARDPMRRIAPRYQSDPAIRRAIRDALTLDPRLRGSEVGIRVRDGAVTLSGSVPDARGRAAAVEDARSVAGVWRVDDELELAPEPRPDDDALARHVEGRLASDAYLARHGITVEAEDGHVVLRGLVDSAFDRRRAQTLAGGVFGARSVSSELELRKPAAPASDPELVGRVRDGLFWDARIDEAWIRVEADDGVVILSGWVDDAEERELAQDKALRSGASHVENRLEVKPRRAAPSPETGTRASEGEGGL